MSQSLESLRADLARLAGLLVTGSATGGSTTTLIDTAGLTAYSTDDDLTDILVYVESAGGAAPEGENAISTDYDAGTQTITFPALTAAVQSGDDYQLFLAPLTLDQWNQAINDAIDAAWPAVYDPQRERVDSTGVAYYTLPATFDNVQAALVHPVGPLRGHPTEVIPPTRMRITGAPGSLVARLTYPVPAAYREIEFFGGTRYAALAAGESTDLDPVYLLAQAAANLYDMLAGHSRSETAHAFYTSQRDHHQGRANRRRDSLATDLEVTLG